MKKKKVMKHTVGDRKKIRFYYFKSVVKEFLINM